MNQKIEKAVKNLRNLLQEECNPHCTDVTIFVNSEGYQITQNLRSPGSLQRDGISMRNIKGQFICHEGPEGAMANFDKVLTGGLAETLSSQETGELSWNKYSENPPPATIGTIILKLESNSHGWVCRWVDASVAFSKYGKTILSSSEWLPYTEKLWSEVSKKYRT